MVNEMRICPAFLFASFLLLVEGSAVWAQTCDHEAGTQTDLNVCAERSYQQADGALNDIYRRLMKTLDPAEKEKLRKAQKAWLGYRDAQCVFNTMGSENGSIHSMVFSRCREDLTRQQTKILESKAQCEEGNLSCVH